MAFVAGRWYRTQNLSFLCFLGHHFTPSSLHSGHLIQKCRLSCLGLFSVLTCLLYLCRRKIKPSFGILCLVLYLHNQTPVALMSILSSCDMVNRKFAINLHRVLSLLCQAPSHGTLCNPGSQKGLADGRDAARLGSGRREARDIHPTVSSSCSLFFFLPPCPVGYLYSECPRFLGSPCQSSVTWLSQLLVPMKSPSLAVPSAQG